MTLTPQDQTAIVAAHNAYRSDPAINTPALQWSSDLATSAQAWANNLAANIHQLQHSQSPTRPDTVGENIAAASPGSRTLTQMVDQWGAEQANFKPGTFPDISTTGNWADAGHYTQMIWRGTAQVGCGIASDDTWDYLVCQYSPAGNMEGDQVP